MIEVNSQKENKIDHPAILKVYLINITFNRRCNFYRELGTPEVISLWVNIFTNLWVGHGHPCQQVDKSNVTNLSKWHLP